jgi:hypothetical protein
MASPSTVALQSRLQIAKSLLGGDGETVFTQLIADGGNFSSTSARLSGKVSETTMNRAAFINSLSELCDNDPVIVETIANDPKKYSNLRDVALNYNPERLKALQMMSQTKLVQVNYAPN